MSNSINTAIVVTAGVTVGLIVGCIGNHIWSRVKTNRMEAEVKEWETNLKHSTTVEDNIESEEVTAVCKADRVRGAKVFGTLYNESIKDIPFNPEWNNGTGYFNGVEHDKSIEDGIYKSYCVDSNRRLLIKRDGDVTIVVFDRYTNCEAAAIRVSVYGDTRIGEEVAFMVKHFSNN